MGNCQALNNGISFMGCGWSTKLFIQEITSFFFLKAFEDCVETCWGHQAFASGLSGVSFLSSLPVSRDND